MNDTFSQLPSDWLLRQVKRAIYHLNEFWIFRSGFSALACEWIFQWLKMDSRISFDRLVSHEKAFWSLRKLPSLRFLPLLIPPHQYVWDVFYVYFIQRLWCIQKAVYGNKYKNKKLSLPFLNGAERKPTKLMTSDFQALLNNHGTITVQAPDSSHTWSSDRLSQKNRKGK